MAKSLITVNAFIAWRKIVVGHNWHLGNSGDLVKRNESNFWQFELELLVWHPLHFGIVFGAHITLIPALFSGIVCCSVVAVTEQSALLEIRSPSGGKSNALGAGNKRCRAPADKRRNCLFLQKSVIAFLLKQILKKFRNVFILTFVFFLGNESINSDALDDVGRAWRKCEFWAFSGEKKL